MAVALLGLALLFFSAASADVVVRDGDTIIIDGQPWRLQGVDAPEIDMAGGRNARQWMISFLRGRAVECQWDGHLSYDRKVRRCHADGQDN